MFYSQAWLSKINDDPWGMQATKAEYSNYFSVMWKIQPLSQEQKKKNPAEEFFTSSTNPQKHLQTIYIPKFLSWLWAGALPVPCYSTWMIPTSGILSPKKLFNRSQGRNSSSLANHSGRWGWAALPGDLGLDSLPLAQFQKFFPKEFLCSSLILFGMGASFIHGVFFLIKWESGKFSLSCWLKYWFLIFIPNVWFLSPGVRRNMDYSPWERGNSLFFPDIELIKIETEGVKHSKRELGDQITDGFLWESYCRGREIKTPGLYSMDFPFP